jgi:hypothetical protein
VLNAITLTPFKEGFQFPARIADIPEMFIAIF